MKKFITLVLGTLLLSGCAGKAFVHQSDYDPYTDKDRARDEVASFLSKYPTKSGVVCQIAGNSINYFYDAGFFGKDISFSKDISEIVVVVSDEVFWVMGNNRTDSFLTNVLTDVQEAACDFEITYEPIRTDARKAFKGLLTLGAKLPGEGDGMFGRERKELIEAAKQNAADTPK